MWEPRKWGLFLVWTPKNGSHSVCKNTISSQNFANHYAKIVTKLFKMHVKRTKICDLYVKLEKWKKGIIRCGLNKKKGSLGVRSG